jgi:Glycosyl transferase 4-like domain
MWRSRSNGRPGQGHDVHLAVGSDSDVGGLPAGLKVHPLPKLTREFSLANDVAVFKQLFRLVRDGQCDAVHTHHSKAGILGRLAARKEPPIVVHTIHMASFGPGYKPSSFLAIPYGQNATAPDSPTTSWRSGMTWLAAINSPALAQKPATGWCIPHWVSNTFLRFGTYPMLEGRR